MVLETIPDFKISDSNISPAQGAVHRLRLCAAPEHVAPSSSLVFKHSTTPSS